MADITGLQTILNISTSKAEVLQIINSPENNGIIHKVMGKSEIEVVFTSLT